MSNSIDPESWPRLALSPEALQDAAEKIINSGALGRSKVYANLLRYLVEAANTNSSPKEIEIAIDVLGRDETFDVAKDSAVRVYIHQLRKKLEHYYERYNPDADFVLTVPKGQYTLEARQRPAEVTLDVEGEAVALEEERATDSDAPVTKTTRRRGLLALGLAAVALLLAANLIFLVTGSQDHAPAAARHHLWQPVLDDEIPILVVMGDYYIFAELDEAGNVKRMIREFGINSKQDLDNLFAAQPELGWLYYDLNLNYLPEGSAVALNSLLPLLHSAGKTVNVKMMSELTTRDLQTHHVVYVGYISALNRIRDMVFSISGLEIGENYDQLINRSTGEVYTSSAGLPSHDQRFLDFGWFIKLPSTRDTQLIMVAGMRDAGLVHMGKALSDSAYLQALDVALAESANDESEAYEALYRVIGLNRMSFDSELVYASYLDAGHLWRAGNR